MFYPEEASQGPGRKTRLRSKRKIQGMYMSSERFKIGSDWTLDNEDDEVNDLWTGKMIFIVDRIHTLDHGTDQRRQRAEVKNRRVSWADVFE